MEFIKPGTRFDFMGAARFWVPFSMSLTVISILAALIFGFDSGIDFKGGSKIIVAFKAGQGIDREAIKTTVNALVEKQTRQKGTQVEVQDFDVGASGETDTVKFQVFTELPSLLTPLMKLEIVRALERHFGQGATAESPQQAGDKFYLTLPDEWPLEAAGEEIRRVFAEAGFPHISVRSDKEERIRADMLREKDLLLSAKDDDVKAEAARVETEAQRRIAAIRDNRFTIEVEAIKLQVEEALRQQFGDRFVEVLSTASVSPSVGKELFQTAMLALVYAIIGILIYVSLRFDMKFAPGAILCLIHDVAVVFGFMVLFKVKFTLPVVAALLTIIGYDVNDTIIVYDRIRENLKKGRVGNLRDVINLSINEVLSRTLITSLTTEIVVLSIAILGGGTIRDFAVLLALGIVLGTYSSIYVAAPLTLWLDRLIRRKAAAQA
ncbi:MAG TPA: protein translocase subunit SecF [Myxococcota bacterium]|nr:protein translocase subunit SecF [Myxococcota bacterium]HQK50652.1 protein translocase subunit SecF [Myxococcota bacterium]